MAMALNAPRTRSIAGAEPGTTTTTDRAIPAGPSEWSMNFRTSHPRSPTQRVADRHRVHRTGRGDERAGSQPAQLSVRHQQDLVLAERDHLGQHAPAGPVVGREQLAHLADLHLRAVRLDERADHLVD